MRSLIYAAIGLSALYLAIAVGLPLLCWVAPGCVF